MPVNDARLLAIEALISQLCNKQVPNRDATESVLIALEPDDASLREQASEHAERIYRAMEEVA